MIYDIWFFIRVLAGIIFMIGFIYFIDWFISLIGLEKHEREFSNAFKKFNKGKLSKEEINTAQNKYHETREKLIKNRIRKEKLKRLKNESRR